MSVHTAEESRLWSIILAASDGKAVDHFVARWLGRPVPKEYCVFVGARSMFQHALDRAEQMASSERLIAVVSPDHRQEAFQQLDQRTIGGLLLHPPHQGTAADVFLPLTYVRERDPDATVVVFPSDHFVYPEARFLAQVRQAQSIVEGHPETVLLLGVAPDRLELDYGWIGAGLPMPDLLDNKVRRVHSLVERPSAVEADNLLHAGGLWNTRTFVAKVSTLWDIGWKTMPRSMPLFERLGKAIGYSRSGDLASAKESASKAIAFGTDRPAMAYFIRGMAFESQGNLQAAHADLRMARQLAPKWADARMELARYETGNR